MSLVLLNLKSDEQIKLDNDSPLIIGRGNVIGCADKRVSRNHGRITCTTDGKIRLLALHKNPCFFTRNGESVVLQLNKNEEETLSEGDRLGLLPNAFWYQIASPKDINQSKEANGLSSVTSIVNENSRTNESDAKDNIVLQSVNNSKTKDCSSSSGNENSSLTENTSNLVNESHSKAESSSSSEKNSNVPIPPKLRETARLPLWMYEIDEPKKQKSPSKTELSSNKETKFQKNTSPKTSSSTNITEGVTSPSTSGLPVNAELLEATSTSCNEPEITILPTVKKESDLQEQQRESCERNVDNVSQANTTKRLICQYEEKCYRRNPQHKLDYCHPGDADFVPYENRPLCQYGAACYRQNEMHKVEYRHPPRGSKSQTPSSSSSCSRPSPASSPLPAKRRRKTVKSPESSDFYDECDENDWDPEDPFADCGSSDEFLPSGLSDDEEWT